MEVKRKVTLLNITENPGELIENVAAISYRTQRFLEKKHPKLVEFKSGRTIPFSELGLKEDPVVGELLPGYRKDDVVVAKIIPPSWKRVVKFLLAIGHHSIFRCCHATFMLENITRKSSLHLLRYGFVATNFQSQKYKNQGSFEYLLPSLEEASSSERQEIEGYMHTIQGMYNNLKRTNLDSEWIRSVYPNIVAQTITFSTNFEQFRHVFDCLTDESYVSENRDIAVDMLRILKKEAPVFFHDFKFSEDGKSAKRLQGRLSRNKKVNFTTPKLDKLVESAQNYEAKNSETWVPEDDPEDE